MKLHNPKATAISLAFAAAAGASLLFPSSAQAGKELDMVRVGDMECPFDNQIETGSGNFGDRMTQPIETIDQETLHKIYPDSKNCPPIHAVGPVTTSASGAELFLHNVVGPVAAAATGGAMGTGALSLPPINFPNANNNPTPNPAAPAAAPAALYPYCAQVTLRTQGIVRTANGYSFVEKSKLDGKYYALCASATGQNATFTAIQKTPYEGQPQQPAQQPQPVQQPAQEQPVQQQPVQQQPAAPAPAGQPMPLVDWANAPAGRPQPQSAPVAPARPAVAAVTTLAAYCGSHPADPHCSPR